MIISIFLRLENSIQPCSTVAKMTGNQIRWTLCFLCCNAEIGATHSEVIE
ncbi:hypothetical protein [Granulicella mallensis]|uniref:Uncharacterized protein n=1 Tax=Granulicella mallensis TaxID=940614 RepID=A0A7W7ZQJ1_9BACT|nr:hypothetical protein [Granulicella mallensis]MBB5063416.1 hypothetical protein [Granulicella mallensis]